MADDGQRPMADIAVETETEEVFRAHLDNGYVIGAVDAPDRPDRSDIGKYGGVYSVE
jgi:hypothetical protein